MTARLTTIARRDAALSVDAPSAGAPSAGASGERAEARGDRPPRSGTEACSVHPGLPRSSFRLSSTSVTTPCVKYSRTSPSHSRLNSSSVLIAPETANRRSWSEISPSAGRRDARLATAATGGRGDDQHDAVAGTATIACFGPARSSV
jgi:hypothetical protein